MKQLVLIFMLISNSSLKAQVLLSQPLGGVSGTDYWIVNYVDHDTSLNLSDYACGNKTYEGHQGTDYVLRSFKTMDTGIKVYAMADGVVFNTKDSVFDRSKVKNNGGLGNYVSINHGSQYWAYYGHLRKNSLTVKVGDQVKEGQVIGLVGSSGNSTDPHLHIEIYDVNSKIIDPFRGSCNSAVSTYWKNQPVYDSSFIVIDNGYTAYIPNLDTLRERYDIRDSIFIGIDTIINFWTEIHGIRAGDLQRVDWFTPTGKLWYSYTYTTPQDYWYAYFWTYIHTPADSLAGIWTAEYSINNKIVLKAPVSVIGKTNIKALPSLTPHIKIYPNPAHDYFYLNLDRHTANKSKIKIDAYNMLGKKVETWSIANPSNEQKLSTSQLKSDIYILKIWSSDQNYEYRKLQIIR